MPLIQTIRSVFPALRSLCVPPLAAVLLLAGCASDPVVEQEPEVGKIVCDSYIILDMCVRDLTGDGQVDMIYFTDTNEIFMYREGMMDVVGQVMSFHQCAVPLSEGMQDTTNRIIIDGQTFTARLGIKRELLANYMRSKSEIDACNASFAMERGETQEPEEEFYIEEDVWEN